MVAEVNELTSVKKEKPTSPLTGISLSFFVLEADYIKKMHFPSRRWLGEKTNLKVKPQRQTDWENVMFLTRVLKEIHYPDLSQISHFTIFCAICW